jgi:hypothetical protein
MSARQKKRQLSRMLAERSLLARIRAQANLLVTEAKAIANRPFVLDVEEEENWGYSDEILIHVTLAPDCDEEDIILLHGDLVEFLKQFMEEEKPDFTWVLRFSRGEEKVLLWPQDEFSGF